MTTALHSIMQDKQKIKVPKVKVRKGTKAKPSAVHKDKRKKPLKHKQQEDAHE